MLQIQFLDKNVIKALVPVFSLKPDKVAFLFDRRQALEFGLKHEDISKAIWDRCPQVDIAFIDADMYVFEDIMSTLEALYEAEEGEVTVDLAGGTELMVACGMLFCEKYNIVPTLCHLSKNKIINAKTGELVAPIVHLSLQDYLTAIGAKHVKRSHSIPEVHEYDSICAVAEHLFEHLDEWHCLHDYLSKLCKDKDIMSFTPPEQLEYKKVEYDSRELLAIFVEHGFVHCNEIDTYTFRDIKAREYMTVYGVWLELYIYIRMKDLFDECYLGYMIDWTGNNAMDTVDNEFDVVGMRKSVPTLISCKMRKPDAADGHEIGYLADHIGGPGAKGIIATTYPIKSDPEVLGKLKRIHVGYIETGDFKNSLPAYILNTAMQNAE